MPVLLKYGINNEPYNVKILGKKLTLNTFFKAFKMRILCCYLIPQSTKYYSINLSTKQSFYELNTFFVFLKYVIPFATFNLIQEENLCFINIHSSSFFKKMPFIFFDMSRTELISILSDILINRR